MCVKAPLSFDGKELEGLLGRDHINYHPCGNGGKDDGAPNIYHKEDSLTALAAPHLKSESF